MLRGRRIPIIFEMAAFEDRILETKLLSAKLALEGSDLRRGKPDSPVNQALAAEGQKARRVYYSSADGGKIFADWYAEIMKNRSVEGLCF